MFFLGPISFFSSLVSGFGFITGIYSTLSWIYDIFSDITVNYAAKYSVNPLSSAVTVFYVLAGVFMLFRVTIAMINYLIDPDRINDRQFGAGKVLVRIVTSVLMLILFQPSGWIFGNFLPKLEHALLSSDGIIWNSIFPATGDWDEPETPIPVKKNNSAQPSNAATMAIDVNAASLGMTCYYLEVKDHYKNMHGSNPQKMTFVAKYKITFYPDKSGKHMIGKKYSYTSDSTSPLSYEALNGDTVSTTFDDFRAVIQDSSSIFSRDKSVFADGFPKSCPKYLKSNSLLSVRPSYIPLANMPDGNTIDTCNNGKLVQESVKKCQNVGILGGFSTEQELIDFLNNFGTKNNNVVNSKDEFVVSTAGQSWLNSDSLKIARDVARSFQRCNDDSREISLQSDKTIREYCKDESKQEECACKQRQMFSSSDANEDMAGVINQGRMEIDVVTSIVAGIGLIVYITFLCVEVFIRRFKLILLQAISPIPIISYADPNDKIFNNWVKMYISVYVDLFIKLFAISIAINLLKSVDTILPNTRHPLVLFFYIVAILVFAKAAPAMISSIFNLNSNGTKFKDIFGMGKAALGFGAGAVAGGVAGVATAVSAFRATKGQGFGNRLLEGLRGTGSVLQGVARGAGSGASGNVFGGARSVAADNSARRSKYATGLKASHLLEAATLGKIGMDHASIVDRAVEKDVAKRDKLMKLTKYQGKITTLARDGGLMKQIQQAKANGFSLDANAEQELALQYAEAMRTGESSASFRARMTNPTNTPYADVYNRLFNDSRFSEYETRHTGGFNWANEASFKANGLNDAIKAAESSGYRLSQAARDHIQIEYDKAKTSGESAASFKARMLNDSKYGDAYKDLFNDQRFEQTERVWVGGFDWNNEASFIDGGVAAQIQTEVDSFNYDLTRSPSLKAVIGKDKIETVIDVKEGNLGAWNGTKIKDEHGNDIMVEARDERGRVVLDSSGNPVMEALRTEGINAISKRINDAVNTPEYAAAKAASGSGKSDNNNK